MANENIAVLGCRLKATKQSDGEPSKVIAIPANIAINVKCDGKPSIIKQLPFIAVGCTAPGGYVLSSGGGVIDNPSSTYIKITNEKPMRKNDKKELACTGILVKTSSPYSPYDSKTCKCHIEIDNSGQSNDASPSGNVTST